jgi:hypothetical protein
MANFVSSSCATSIARVYDVAALLLHSLLSVAPHFNDRCLRVACSPSRDAGAAIYRYDTFNATK